MVLLRMRSISYLVGRGGKESQIADANQKQWRYNRDDEGYFIVHQALFIFIAR